MTNEMQSNLDVPQLVLEAHERCRDHLCPTPLEYSMYFSQQIDGEHAWDAEKEERRVAGEEDRIYMSPYNDPIVVGGQGTCGYEISEQLPDLHAAFFACGGGVTPQTKRPVEGQEDGRRHLWTQH